MMMRGKIANAGVMNEAELPGLRSGLLDRRSLLLVSAAGFGALGLAGCATTDGLSSAEVAALYGPIPDKKFPIPAADVSKVDPKYYRRTVRYDSKEAPGTIVVDPSNYYVYRKAEWPVWTPPKEMIKRQPEAAKYAGGMPGGPDNPLGARTLYLYQNGRYTLYTLYSTSDPETIGTNLTSGCTGLLTQDMFDLYGRTPVNTKVVVLPA